MNFRDFGKKHNPIRMSSLPMLLTCPGFAVLRSLEDDSSGVAALNGTAIGHACELWHHGVEPAEAIERSLGESPGAEAEFVSSILNEYVLDPRNAPYASLKPLPEFQEIEVTTRLRGSTGYFYFTGHIDQLREDEHGDLAVWDLKAGRMYGGNQMIDCYAAQQVMYAIGMSEMLGVPVGYGGIIRLRGYIGRTNLKLPVADRPVFFNAGWDLDRCRSFADRMIYTLDSIRRGRVQAAPGSQCSFCPAGGAINCVSMLEGLGDG
jgi:hypothetical protein